MVNKDKAASPEQPSAPQEVSDDELTETELDAVSGGNSENAADIADKLEKKLRG